MRDCLSYASGRGRWVGTPEGCSFELVVDGSPSEISRPALALAESGLAQQDALSALAVSYLHRFVHPDATQTQGTAVPVALFAASTGDMLTLDLSFPGDAYGLWWVEFFRHAHGGFEPSAFGRLAW